MQRADVNRDLSHIRISRKRCVLGLGMTFRGGVFHLYTDPVNVTDGDLAPFFNEKLAPPI